MRRIKHKHSTLLPLIKMAVFTLLLILVILLNGMWVLMLASVLATEFGYRNIPSYEYGYILSSSSISSMITWFSASWLVSKIGRSNMLFTGIVTMSISMSLMGFTTFIKDNLQMIAFGVFWRFWQGFSKTLIQIPGVSI